MTSDWHVTSVDVWVVGVICFLTACTGVTVSVIALTIPLSWPNDVTALPWIVVVKCAILLLAGMALVAAGLKAFYCILTHILER